MGVINVTPNSFSDGGKLSSSSAAKKAFESCVDAFDIVDVGAESTAPFNPAVGAKEELQRLEDFFYPLLDAMPDPATSISIDTYKPEVFYEVALELARLWPKCELVFNDISGKVDSELIDIFKSELNFSYVLCHNLCPSREFAGDHMDHLSDYRGNDFVDAVSDFFVERIEELGESGRKVWIDPCFGFSKTREQNLDLLRGFGRFAQALPKRNSLLVGISRKSFLRFPKDLDPKLAPNQSKLDMIQTALCADMLSKCPEREFVFRSHNHRSLEAVGDVAAILGL